MELDKTDEVVAHVREWSIEKVDSDIPMENARAIYEEFEEWIELDEEKGGLEIMSLEPFDDQIEFCWLWKCWMYYCFISFMV